MAANYAAIRADNERRYGTDIGRIGPMLLADRYDDRTHFIFELLQNAEDALSRRDAWNGSRSVTFHLSDAALRVEHFGKPFDEADVRGICGIAESTKDLTEIGRFGIGFKSVYAVTRRPEIHSGAEAFAIENFVWPVAAPLIDRKPDATVILIPLATPEAGVYDDLGRGLARLGPSALLFLRQIEEIRWSIEGGRSGLFLRESREVAQNAGRITMIGQEQDEADVAQEWLIFSRPVPNTAGPHAGCVELAFPLTEDGDSRRERIASVDRSPLVVFFPTVLETHLGFHIQGPYRTTPSRDNVPRGDAWNRRLVTETATLLRKTLCWLRDHDLLDTAALRCLPLDPTKFGASSMFAPLYDATKTALSSEALLPRFDAGHVPASRARIGRTQEMRQLFAPAQLGLLFDAQDELVWLSGDITQDRTPELRRYLMQELEVPELTPDAVVPRLSSSFLEVQSDGWILSLYEFLHGQQGLRRRFQDLPLVRLEDGSHVPAQHSGQPQAFLPGPIASGFPLVRAAISRSEAALEFLRSLGLTQPDPVDDVVRNVLPRYQTDPTDVSDDEYAADIARILHAFGTDSKGQRDKLLTALRETAFVRAANVEDRACRMEKAEDVYLGAERLKALFAGVECVLFADDTCQCLRGEPIRELLEACGATRSLCPVRVDCHLTWEERAALRRDAGLERSTWESPIDDVTLRGLDALLRLLPSLGPDQRRMRAELLWDGIADLESRRGARVFSVDYTWGYSHETKKATFDAAFVDQLNSSEWVAGADGKLQLSAVVAFDTLGWEPNPFLQSRIRFKPPILDQLAKEAGIEAGVLDLLKQRGITSEAQLRELLGVEEEEPAAGDEPGDVGDALNNLGITREPTPPVPDPAAGDPAPASGRGDGAGTGAGTGAGGERKPGSGASRGAQTGTRSPAGGTSPAKRTPADGGARPFISYVAAHPDDEEPDPDGLDQAARMALEEKAIGLILSHEPRWQRTPTHNPGFDLFEAGANGQPARWCEVKAMTGSLAGRPVGLSRTQFECAREHGGAYWLYVVEHAGTDEARLVRIQDPAGKACTFTFDHGWLAVAGIDDESEERED